MQDEVAFLGVFTLKFSPSSLRFLLGIFIVIYIHLFASLLYFSSRAGVALWCNPVIAMYSLTFLSLLTFFSTFSTARLIHDVTATGFDTLLQENNLLLVTFTSRNFEPLDPFHDILKEAADGMRTPFVMIDCDRVPELCLKYDVNAYPALRLFKKVESNDENKNEDAVEDKEYRTEMTRYRGKKTKGAIRSFVAKHELPVITHITPSTLADFKKVDDIVIIAYLRPDQKALLEVFSSTAEKHQGHFVFGYSTDMPTADAEGLAMPAIACYKNTDGDHKVMNGHFKEEDIETFLKTATKPVIFDFSERNMNMFMAVSRCSNRSPFHRT